jgi:ATP-dependent Lon protease
MHEEAKAEANRQLRRLERMHPDGPEAQVVRVYLDWLVDLPWSVTSPDALDLQRAREVLDQDHSHLAAVKERILELLAVRKLREDARGPILCFSGPPGVGKTSLGRSIARAMGREFVRVSLGGVRDEAEIRGHRRTYVGALPGRVIQGIKQAGTRNPVFMLDEVDKVGTDFRGDPAAALLEVLDPEQNSRFSDHYLNVPFDLSGVLFIATANVLDTIPGPLRDRMEVIPIPGYTLEEKIDIARSHLVPRQVREHGLPDERVRWSTNSLRRTVTEYTREAGVRNLERQIATICRKSARRAAEGDETPLRISRRTLSTYLGPPFFPSDVLPTEGDVGVVNGLAWTEAGGEVLRLEATLTRGRGLVLTGQLGDVMKESGHAALTYARWRAPELGVDDALLSRNGAVRRDHDRDRDRVAGDTGSGAGRCRHDGRGDASRARLARRRRAREGARGTPLRDHARDPAEGQPTRAPPDPERAQAAGHLHSRDAHGRGDRGGPRGRRPRPKSQANRTPARTPTRRFVFDGEQEVATAAPPIRCVTLRVCSCAISESSG